MTATTIWLLLTCGVGADRPNFVVMMTDDQRADKFSHTGDPLLKTPNLDKLRAGGMSFRRMYVTNALCAPHSVIISPMQLPASSNLRARKT